MLSKGVNGDGQTSEPLGSRPWRGRCVDDEAGDVVQVWMGYEVCIYDGATDVGGIGGRRGVGDLQAGERPGGECVGQRKLGRFAQPRRLCLFQDLGNGIEVHASIYGDQGAPTPPGSDRPDEKRRGVEFQRTAARTLDDKISMDRFNLKAATKRRT
ncbi:hypothetical protein VTK73DRAFT_9175 [Phialemonium thermophilum]|uniref:Uncharacterized protein n=1 Tax=Phialemonium thermophilum TaxID=223376 RepID=A0ABR3W3V5_9PEZI